LQPSRLMSRAAKLEAQARLAGEAGEAMAALPAAQRYAFTTWGLRDKDSWLRHAPNAGDGTDAPLFFDDEGRPKPAAAAFLKGARGTA
jgi:endo-1,4-beta-xylanase